MALFTFRLPDIGEGVATAEIVAWHVKIGDRVEEDQPVADMMTDKATVEMESPVAGVITRLAGEPGAQIAIGATLFEIETDSEIESEDEVAPSGGTPPPGVKANNVDSRDTATSDAETPTDAVLDAMSPLPPPVREGSGGAGSSVLASPAVRARARALGIDLALVKGDGGRIRHGDLDTYLLYGAGQGYRSATRPAPRPDEEVKVIGMRRRIAENMAAAKRHIPHFTYVEEIDVTALEALRVQLNGGRGDRPRLTMLPLLIVALCKALPDFPMLNARYDDDAGVVTRHGAVHLGIATQTDAGLMVPVIRDAQDRNVWQLAQQISRLADAARAGTAKSEELSGSTLTLTSLGRLGGIATTPIVNRPEVAIIAPNRVIERPVFRGGDVVAARLMNLSISCDHRVVDGWDAASFVQAVKALLEMPALLFAD
ncbi:MAG: dihydrolipoamide acetyltransferase family protein [Sphingobium sp.]